MLLDENFDLYNEIENYVDKYNRHFFLCFNFLKQTIQSNHNNNILQIYNIQRGVIITLAQMMARDKEKHTVVSTLKNNIYITPEVVYYYLKVDDVT